MGKWSQVRCNCHNRIPLPKSSWHDLPNRNQRRKKLSPKQKKEIAAWEDIEGMCECGHRDGILIQLYPGEIVKLGFAIEKVFGNDLLFEIYPRVGDWHNYFSEGFDEELQISPAEAELWLMEAVELELAFLDQGNIPYKQVRQLINILHYREARSDRSLDRYFESVAEMGFTKTLELLNNLNDLRISRDSILERQFVAISRTKELCQAAIESGNPIEMLW